MTTLDIPASSSLLKAARTGTAKSRPATPPAMSDTSALDAVFGAAAEPASEPAIEVRAGAAQISVGVSATSAQGSDTPEQIVVPPAKTGSDVFSRMLRLGAAAGGATPEDAPAEPSTPVQAPASMAAPAPAPTAAAAARAAPSVTANVFERMGKFTENRDATMKKAMAGAKVLTPLVAAVSFAPGLGSPPAERRAALTATLLATQRVAEDMALAFEGTGGAEVPQWIKTQLMTAVAEQLAKRIERQRTILTEDQVQAFAQDMALIPKEYAGVLAEVVDSACNDAYRPVQSKNDARSRLQVTLASCAWKMYDWVTHERLSVDPAGEHPSRFFSYGMDIDRIVQDLLRAAVDQASAFVVSPEDADMRVAHLQNSVNRFTNLIGAEYVTRTRATMNWIGEVGLTPQEAQARSRQACERFPTEGLPRILEHARSTFVYIENGAAQVADGFHKSLMQEPIIDILPALKDRDSYY